LLEALQQDPPADERSIVLSGLAALNGSKVDDLLLQALRTTSAPAIQVDLIRLLDNRGVAKAVPEILKQTSSPQKNVQIAALSALSSLAGHDQLPALIAFTRSCTDQEAREAAENALVGVCSRSGDAASSRVLNELNHETKPADRNSWLRVLARVGYTKALPVIELAVTDQDPTVAENALTQLGQWPNPEPMKTLLKTMDSSASATLRQRALDSVINLSSTALDEAQAPETTIVSWLQPATRVAESTQDKRQLLGLLGRLKTEESFRLLVPYLDDPAVRTEAASGVVQMAPLLAKSESAEALKSALVTISQTVTNDELRDRARQLANTVTVTGGPVSLFDGRSLAGWEGDTNVWRVRNGLIVGGSLQGNPRNEFLATVKSYTNFTLRLEYKLIGTEGFINSGVQFRSVRLTNPPNEMKGYQADIGAGYSGCLYDESRRNTVLARASAQTIQRVEKTNDWNSYQIRAEGNHIQIQLNGDTTVDYAEPDAAIIQSGLIGLQIHGGNKAEVYFRNITIQEF